jgi:hypothetical protein
LEERAEAEEGAAAAAVVARFSFDTDDAAV